MVVDVCECASSTSVGWGRAWCVQQSSSPAVQQSSSPAVQQSSNPAVQQSSSPAVQLSSCLEFYPSRSSSIFPLCCTRCQQLGTPAQARNITHRSPAKQLSDISICSSSSRPLSITPPHVHVIHFSIVIGSMGDFRTTGAIPQYITSNSRSAYRDTDYTQQSSSPTIQQSSNPAVQQSSSPASQQSSSPAVQQCSSPAVQQSSSPALQQSSNVQYVHILWLNILTARL